MQCCVIIKPQRRGGSGSCFLFLCMGTGSHWVGRAILPTSYLQDVACIDAKHTCSSLGAAINWVEMSTAAESRKRVEEGREFIKLHLWGVFVLGDNTACKKELSRTYMNAQVVLVYILYPAPVSIRKDGKQQQPWWKQPPVFTGATNNSQRKRALGSRKSHVHKLPKTRPGTRKEANALETHHTDHRENKLN